ncbi:MAG: glycine zipper 2TM domain-containing protein [Exilibacterium sp.]
MKTIILALTTVLFIASLPAAASHNGRIDFARVTNVAPIYRTVEHRVPEKQCWTETVAYEQPGYRSNTGTILGGLIGAAVGNSIGHHKRNKQVGAVAGAVLGASIGRDIGHRTAAGNGFTEYRDEQRCEVKHRVEYEETVVGYDVTYRYRGQIYHTRTDQHPGKRIKVAVKVRPVY